MPIDGLPFLKSSGARVLVGLSLVALGATLGGCQLLRRPAPAPLPVLFQVPPFSLTAQNGAPFGSDDLLGSPWVANLFFTSCPSVCPGHMASLARLQERLVASTSRVAIVSVSVDPATDTPERLAAYSERLGVDPGRWHLLAGDEAAVRAVVEGGFLSAMGSPLPVTGGRGGHSSPTASGKPVYEISHSARFYVVDEAGRVRALVPAEGDPVPALLAALAALALGDAPP